MREDSTARGLRASTLDVVAVLGDTVVDVKRCVATNRGSYRVHGRRAWLSWHGRAWLLATSALCLVASAIAFEASVDLASENAASLQHHLALHHPAYSFRSVEQSSAIGIVMFAGLAIALATAIAFLRARSDRTDYRVGTAPGVDLALATAPRYSSVSDGARTREHLVDAAFSIGDSARELACHSYADFPLFTPVGDAFVFTFAGGFVGDLTVDNVTVSLAELAENHLSRPSSRVANAMELAIPRRAKIRVRFGNVIVSASSIDEPAPVSLRPRASIDRGVLASLGFALALQLGVLALFEVARDDDSAPAEGGWSMGLPADGYVTIDTFDDTVATSAPKDDARDGNDDHDGNDVVDSDDAHTSPTVRSTTLEDRRIYTRLPARLEREQAIELARRAGLLGSTSLGMGIATLASSGDVGAGFGARGFDGVGMYGVSGDGVASVEMFAARRRFAPEGGGGRWETVCGEVEADCRSGTIGHGSGTGSGYSPGSRAGGHGSSHFARVPDVVALGRPKQTGGIPVEILRRYIKRKSDELSACFEKALLANPTLSGTVITDFLVAPDGSVHGARASGVRDVATCVSIVVSSIKFPAPDGGQAVRVTYPLQFRVPGAG